MKTPEYKSNSFSLPPPAMEWILKREKDIQVILELGSGVGTEFLSERFKMYSIENDPAFVGRYNSTYIHAPITGSHSHAWYDGEIVKERIPEDYCLLIIDGPVGDLRKGILQHMELFRKDRPVIIDDAQRQVDQLVTQAFSKHLGVEPILYNDSIFGYRKFAVLEPR